ncbi:molybdenum cofactor synthesis domain protein [Selenomonas sp. oral taxon 137 str. F0430]|jgi:molybdenum cofactor biosynthesis protein B|uniref:MOSC domain-containing protein n=1 Tax=Selenomonas sp. oral taxon 137 TaxID=712531 RepID=UPI0001EB20DA|nr:MOSC domain-containing protein [Selenomonas sp. oral taxon 137]EFR40067.1 molybdenum cofactor synthesis domain protein [Selenomonas sp. oral taxon 137 str. F0430]
MGKIRALCISEKRGTQKHALDRVFFVTEHGMDGDAHAGDWHRQVSLLGLGEIDDFRARGADVDFGAFGENLVAEGFRFKELPIGTRLRVGDVFLEITQIGKECHSHCQIFHQVGDCIMPREGVFARVLHGGWVTVGDELELTTDKILLDAAVLTASDKGSRGEREDKSGAAIREMLTEAGYAVAGHGIVPDEKEAIARELTLWSDRGVALVLTTGGTGFSVRDVTPEATRSVIERETPGIPEAMRALSMQITHRAMLTRAAAGIRKRTLIVNLPGSEKAVRECLGFILPELRHGIEILRGDTGECAR